MRRSLALWIAVPVLVGILSYWLVSTSFIRKLEAKLTGAPVIEYPQSVDLGEQEQGSVAVAPLTIANRGRSELVVNGIGSSCSCSGLEQEQQGAFVVVSEFRLAPGEERHLRVRVSVNGFPARSAVGLWKRP